MMDWGSPRCLALVEVAKTIKNKAIRCKTIFRVFEAYGLLSV